MLKIHLFLISIKHVCVLKLEMFTYCKITNMTFGKYS